MIEDELEIVRTVSSFDPAPILFPFLVALFSTATFMALVLCVTIKDLVERELAVATLLQAQAVLRMLLSLTTVWLVIGVVGVGLFHRMVASALAEPQRELIETVGASSTILSGAFYSALMASTFGPAELLFRNAASGVASASGAAPESTGKWLTENGIGLSLTQSLMRVFAVFGPLIAGVIQNLAELK